MIYEMWRFFGTSVGCSNVVYTVLYVFLTSVIGLCCKMDYNLEIEVKIHYDI